MSDEIKEILQKIENVANRETASRNALMEMKDKDYQLLLDYITNLQTIEREYSNLLSENAELQQENDRLNNIINELGKNINEEIERTNNFILEDSSLIEINNIRKMLNDDRQCWLYKLKELKENNNE